MGNMASKKKTQSVKAKPKTTGAVKLVAWMHKNAYSINKLARALDVERFSLTRILEGQEKHVNLEFAFRAQELTKGEILVEDFRQITKALEAA